MNIVNAILGLLIKAPYILIIAIILYFLFSDLIYAILSFFGFIIILLTVGYLLIQLIKFTLNFLTEKFPVTASGILNVRGLRIYNCCDTYVIHIRNKKISEYFQSNKNDLWVEIKKGKEKYITNETKEFIYMRDEYLNNICDFTFNSKTNLKEIIEEMNIKSDFGKELLNQYGIN